MQRRIAGVWSPVARVAKIMECHPARFDGCRLTLCSAGIAHMGLGLPLSDCNGTLRGGFVVGRSRTALRVSLFGGCHELLILFKLGTHFVGHAIQWLKPDLGFFL